MRSLPVIVYSPPERSGQFKKGCAIPEEIGFASFDETIWTPLVRPALTVIEQPMYEIGQTATELLLKRLKDPSRPNHEIILKSKLIVRQFVGYITSTQFRK